MRLNMLRKTLAKMLLGGCLALGLTLGLSDAAMAQASRAPAAIKTKAVVKQNAKKTNGLKSSKSIQGTKTTVSASGQKTIYQYTKYQKFDFEDMDIGTDGSAPGDLSITGRYQKQFQNKLPYRRNFRPEILEAIERIR